MTWDQIGADSETSLKSDRSPVALAFAIVPATGRPTLFIDPAKVGDNVQLCFHAPAAGVAVGDELWPLLAISGLSALATLYGVRTADYFYDNGDGPTLRITTRSGYRVEGTPNRRIVLDADNNVRFQKRSMLHVAVGQRAYAERYYAKKVRDGLPGAQLKSFRIPRSEHEALRLRAVAQADAKEFPRSPQVVDPTQAPDLYGLRRSDFRQLQKTIVPGSGRVVR